MKLDRITIDPNRMNEQPRIRNLRLTVRRAIELLATYDDRNELRQKFPELDDEDVQQALLFTPSYRDDRAIEILGRQEGSSSRLSLKNRKKPLVMLNNPNSLGF